MTRNEIVSLARIYSRVDTLGVTDANAYIMVNQAIRAFSEDVGGIVKEEFLQIAARFWVETTMAIRITITGGTNAQAATDVAITASDQDDISGATMASTLQTAIRTLAGVSTATVAWSDFAFTIDSIDGTDITIEAPSDTATYEDATDLLFGGTKSSGAQTYVGSFPKGCTKRIALPSDFRSVKMLEWDERELDPKPLGYIASLTGEGDPYYYALGADDDDLWLDRSPSSRDLLWLQYRATPADLSSDATPDIEADYHHGLVWKVSELLCMSQFDDRLAERRRAEYERVVGQYRERYANRNTSMRTDRDDRFSRGGPRMHLRYTVED